MRHAVGLALLLAAIALPAEKPSAKAPPGKAKRLFLSRCSSCHDPGRVYHRTAARDEWREIVNRMRRMPQSGISPQDAAIILDYLVSLRGRAPEGTRIGGRRAYGKEWLAILQVAAVRDGRVRLGRVSYAATRDGLEVALKRGKQRHVVSLTAAGQAGKTARIDRWKIGKAIYELHLVLYEIRGETVRIAHALRKLP